MSKRLALVWVLFFLAALAASAGDVAQFVNLGFSKDARYFMFGQFGITQKDSTPWADTFIVDVPANAFAAKGTMQFVGTQPVDPGANGLGALLNALSDALGDEVFRRAPVTADIILTSLEAGKPVTETLTAHI